MEKVSKYKNTFDEEMVLVVNEDGSAWSGTQAAYDELQALKNEL